MTYLYDIPDPDEFSQLLRDALEPAALNASIEVEPRRVPHAERARRAAAAGGADFLINGVWVTAIAGFPADAELQVLGREVDYGGTVGRRWESISVQAATAPRSSGARAATTASAGRTCPSKRR